MITAAFALLSVLGTWLTWRHNPAFSWKSTLRFVGTALLLMAAAAGLMTLAVKLSDGRSAAAQVALLGGGIILCSLGLILGISAASTPRGANTATKLPPNVALVHLYRPRIRPWFKRAAILLGVCLLVMLIPGPVRYIAGIVAGFTVGLGGCIMLPVAYYTALRADRAVTGLQLHPWVHWHYAPEVWQAWVDRLAEQRAQAQAVALSPSSRRRTTAFLALFGVAYAIWAVPASLPIRVASGLATGLVVLGIASLAGTGAKGAVKREAARLRAAAPETFFGQDGVLCNGELCAWLAADVYLLSASITAGPPRCIEFRFEKISPSGYGGTQSRSIRQPVLIPADVGASDFAQLQAALSACCPKAEIQLL